ncbi:hypothetical protein ED28_15435 [[Pantoea] beijingensis]|uniref:Uncharacterized protein n=1 Tax=[Pantoea] beijingensis TaxID=1324864 RepID=A0A443IAE0_9GAMM|nr:hypothetical protein ED28_15435 [[Pantoea] beijingensis]
MSYQYHFLLIPSINFTHLFHPHYQFILTGYLYWHISFRVFFEYIIDIEQCFYVLNIKIKFIHVYWGKVSILFFY